MPRLDLGSLVVSVDANTRAYERAMLRMEALTVASMATVSTHTDRTTKSVDRLDKHFRMAALGALSLKAASAMIMPTGFMSLIGPAISGIGALAGGAVIAAQSVTSLSGALAGMPFLLGAAGQGVATLALGTKDLITAMGQSDDIDKFNESLKRMDPATQKAARSLYSLKDEFQQIKASAAAGLLPGVVQGINSAVKNVDVLNSVLYGTGKVIGDVFAKFGQYLGSPEFGKMFMEIGARGAQSMQIFGEATLKIFDALTKITVAAKPLTDFFNTLIVKFGDWVQKTVDAGIESGKFADFMYKTIAGLQAWGTILYNVGSLIHSIFKAANPAAQIFLGWLIDSTGRLKEWAKSTEGMKKMSDFFANISVPLAALGGAIGEIFKSLSGLFSPAVMGALAQFLTVLGQGLSQIISQGLPSTVVALGGAITPLLPMLAEFLVQVSNIGTAILQTLTPAIQILAPIFTDLFRQLGPVLVDIAQRSAPAVAELAQSMGDFLRVLAPTIPELVKMAAAFNVVPIYGLATSFTIVTKAIIFFGQAAAMVAEVFMIAFVKPTLAGMKLVAQGAALVAEAMGNKALADGIRASIQAIDAWEQNTIDAFTIARSQASALQSQLNILGHGTYVPITIGVSYAGVGGGGIAPAGKGVSAAFTAAAAQAKAEKERQAALDAITKSMKNFTGSSYKPPAAAGSSAASAAASKAAQALATAQSEYAKALASEKKTLSDLASAKVWTSRATEQQKIATTAATSAAGLNDFAAATLLSSTAQTAATTAAKDADAAAQKAQQAADDYKNAATAAAAAKAAAPTSAAAKNAAKLAAAAKTASAQASALAKKAAADAAEAQRQADLAAAAAKRAQAVSTFAGTMGTAGERSVNETFVGQLLGTYSESPILSNFKSMVSGVWEYLGQGTRNYISDLERQMEQWATWQIGVLNQLSKAEDDLASKMAERAQYASDVTAMVTGYANLSSSFQAMMSDNEKALSDWQSAVSSIPQNNFAWTPENTALANSTAPTPQSMLGTMTGRLSKIKDFWNNIQKLRSMGLDPGLIKEIVAAGVDDGNAMAKEILSTPAQIGGAGGYNDIYGQIQSFGASFGSTLGSQFFDAGVNAAQGIVDGLRSQAASIEGAMNWIAQTMLNAIKSALGIASPAKEFVSIAGYSVDGLVVGFRRNRNAAVEAVKNLYGAMASTTLDLSGSAYIGAGAGGPTITVSPGAVVIDARGATDPAAVEAAGQAAVDQLVAKIIRELNAR